MGGPKEGGGYGGTWYHHFDDQTDEAKEEQWTVCERRREPNARQRSAHRVINGNPFRFVKSTRVQLGKHIAKQIHILQHTYTPGTLMALGVEGGSSSL